jgi:glucokinase
VLWSVNSLVASMAHNSTNDPVVPGSSQRRSRLGRPSTMRVVNRTIVADAIREHAPLSRADVARLTAISAPTVSAIVAELIRDGLVRELSEEPSQIGRPPRLLVFNENAFYIGCDLSISKTVRIGLVSANDKVSDVQALKYEVSSPKAEYIADLIAGYVHELTHQRSHVRLLGLGVGAPGVTDIEAGLVRWAPTLGWREVPFTDLLSARLDIPVIVDNDVNLALIGEVNQGAARRAQHAIFVAFSDGVGGAVLMDGRLYRGRGEAGEVGYMVTDTFGPRDDLRSFGSTERRIFRLLANECTRVGISTDGLEWQTATVANLLVANDGNLRLTQDTRAALIDTIAAALASMTALLNPEVVVLAGWIEHLGYELLLELETKLQRLVPTTPTLRFSELGLTATIVGSAISIRHASTESTHIMGAT